MLARKGGLEFSRLVPSLTILILPSGRFKDKDKEAEILQKNCKSKKSSCDFFKNLFSCFFITVGGWHSVFCAFFNSASLPLMNISTLIDLCAAKFYNSFQTQKISNIGLGQCEGRLRTTSADYGYKCSFEVS